MPDSPHTAGQSPASSERFLARSMARLGLPAFLFGVTFLMLTLVLRLLLSPDRFPVRAGDGSVRLIDLRQEETKLDREQAMLLERRQQMKSEDRAPVLRQSQELKAKTLRVGAALAEVERVRRSFVSPVADPITLPVVMFESGTLHLAGTVTDPGGRSVQLLAAFVNELRSISVLRSVSEPEYVSDSLAGGGTSSPFRLILTLRE